MDNLTAAPLFVAAQEGHLTVVTKLIAAGADVDKATTDDGSTPLYIAAQSGHLTVVMKLIAAGADVNKARTTDGSTPLYIAAYKRAALPSSRSCSSTARTNRSAAFRT